MVDGSWSFFSGNGRRSQTESDTKKKSERDCFSGKLAKSENKSRPKINQYSVKREGTNLLGCREGTKRVWSCKSL